MFVDFLYVGISSAFQLVPLFYLSSRVTLSWRTAELGTTSRVWSVFPKDVLV